MLNCILKKELKIVIHSYFKKKGRTREQLNIKKKSHLVLNNTFKFSCLQSDFFVLFFCFNSKFVSNDIIAILIRMSS